MWMTILFAYSRYGMTVSRWILCSDVKPSGNEWVILDQIFALDDIQAIGDAAEVHSTEMSAYFAADAAST